MPIACGYPPRSAVEAERQRRSDLTTRLILIGEATVFDCSLGAETSGVRPGMRMSEAIGLCHRAAGPPPGLPAAAGRGRRGRAARPPPGEEAPALAPLPAGLLPASVSLRWRLRLLG